MHTALRLKRVTLEGEREDGAIKSGSSGASVVADGKEVLHKYSNILPPVELGSSHGP